MAPSIKKLLLSLFSIFLVSCTSTTVRKVTLYAASERVIGQDYLAAQSRNFNLQAAVKYDKDVKAFGSLDITFGTDLTPIRFLLSSTSPTFYRVHLLNGPCVRNGNCGSYEIVAGYSKASLDEAIKRRDRKILVPFRARVTRYRNLGTEFPGVKFLLSPVLEHDLSRGAWRILADEIKKIWPEVQLVNSPDGGVESERYLDSWIERHGDKPQSDADISSLDGVDASQINIDAFIKRTVNEKITFIWQGNYNCRTGEWVDPRARAACPHEKSFELLSSIANFRGADGANFTGKQCKSISSFAAPAIWKPLAERHVKPDPREELPLLITKNFGRKEVQVLSSNGGRVGTLGFYGTYLDQGFRYYSGYKGGSNDSGYEWEKAAKAATGYPHIWLYQDGKCLGPLIGGKRQGEYH